MGPPNSAGAPGAARDGDLLGGRYRLDRPLATGGMARVWQAHDEVLGRPVAVKVLLEHLVEDVSFVTRFRAEALAAARLTHPAVVSVYDTCSAPGVEAIVMELVEGETLRDRLDRERRLEEHEAARIGARIAEALTVAHGAGIVHRDIKPANVLLAPGGRVVVTDFGIAKAAEAADLTSGDQMLGTAKYLSPEQVEGRKVDGRADLYALGVVLFEALCGRVPFLADTEAATALARLHQDPPRPSSWRPDLDRDLERIVERLLARDRDARWPDADTLARSLGAFATGRPLPPDPPLPIAAARPEAPVLAKADADAGAGTRSWRADDPVPAAPLPGPVAPAPPAPPPPGPAAPPFAPSPPPPAHPPPPTSPHPPHRAPRRLGPTLLLVLVLSMSVLIIAALAWQVLGPGRTETLTPTAASAFDPPAAGGDGVENSDQTPAAIDGDAETAWTTERYTNPDITLLKPGVGLVLELGERHTVEGVEVTSPSEGWTAEVYVFDDVPREPFVGTTDPVATVSEIDGDLDVSFGRTEGTVVVLWITRAGTEGTVSVAEARVVVAA